MIALAGAVLTAIAIAVIYAVTNKKYYRMQKLYGTYASTVRYNLRHLLLKRSNNAQSFEEEKVSGLSESICKDESFVMKSVLSALSISSLIVNGLTAFIVIAGGKTMLNLELTIGNIFTYLQYSMLIITAFMMLSTIVFLLPRL